MNAIVTGMIVILYLQSLGSWLVYPMKFFSFLGYEQFYILIAPALYWCVNTELGIRFGLFLMASTNFNSVFKLAFHSPRPYWYDPRVRAYGVESTFGIPSGHAQNAVVVWGTLARNLRERWAWLVAILLMFFIGFSRLVLGVHFPLDVLVGWLIGAVLLWAMVKLEAPITTWLKQRSLLSRLTAALVISLLMMLAGAVAKSSLGDWQIPEEWSANAHTAVPDADPIQPLSFSDLMSSAGAFFGLATGAILIYQSGGFNPAGTAWQQAARYLFGMVGVVILWMGLGAVLPRGEDLVAMALRFIRYSLIGLWIAYIAPLAFYRLNLATPPPKK